MGSLPGKFSPLFSRRSAGGPYTIANIDECPSDVWFVDSSATNAGVTTRHGYTPDMPFATLAYAFSSDMVTSGDVVYVMPSHAETLDAAGDITMDIAGVRVVGLCRGSVRPTFTFSTLTTATWLITAANCSVENVLITVTGVIDMANAITVTAADCTLADIEVRDSAATSQFADPIIIGAGANRCRLTRYICRSHASGDAAQSGVLVSSAVDGVEIDDAQIDGLFLTGCIETSAANTNMVVRRPILRQRHATTDAAINLNAGTTGFVDGARIRIATNDLASYNGAVVGAGAQFYDTLVTTAGGTYGTTPGLVAVPDASVVPGTVYYVNSGAAGAADAAANGTSKSLPFATLAYAFSSARVASGDVVYVMPGHAETLDAAGDITMNVAGVRVVGLGSGSARPTFTFATLNTATWLVTAANVTVENVLITVTGVLDMASAITVTAADCLLRDVEIRDSAANSQFVDPIIVGAGGARCRLVRYICRSHAAGDAAASGVLVSSAVDGVEIDDAQIDGLFATGCIETTDANTNMKVRRCELRQRHATTAAAVNLNAGTTGFVRDTVAYVTLATGAGFNGAFVGTIAVFDSCRAVNAAGTATMEPLLASGRILSRASGAIAGDPTIVMFTVAGGDVMIKRLWLKVTTEIAFNGGTLAVQINPTVGDTMVIVTATDLGTANTTVGSIVGIDAAAAVAPSFLRGGRTDINAAATTGAVELVGAAGCDGAVTMYVEWEPITAGATVVAA